MMWKTRTIYSSIANGQMIVDSRFTEGVPKWDAFDRFARSWPSRLFWGALYVLMYVQFASVWWLWLLLPLQFILSPIHGAIINWFAHKYGYRNFEVGDTSKNFLPVDFLMMGESYHNNHHKHGSRANFGGIRWHEIDPTYLVIRLLNRLKIIQLTRQRSLSVEDVKKAA
jgi:stearoyl-CoA desaturase (delta-9 desaturase)